MFSRLAETLKLSLFYYWVQAVVNRLALSGCQASAWGDLRSLDQHNITFAKPKQRSAHTVLLMSLLSLSANTLSMSHPN